MGGPPAVTGKPVTITLTVNAADLFNANPQPTSQTALDAYCSLSDDNLGSIPPGKTLNEFTSEVFDGKTVTWRGASSSPGYRVLIDSITNNTSFFSSDPPGNNGVVTATVRTDVSPDTEDTYTITFTIDSPGNESPKTYALDPKLRAKSSS